MEQNKRLGDKLANATDLIREGLDEVEELKEEIVTKMSRMEATKFENHRKYLQIEEIWDTLEGALSEIDSACSSLECIEFPE